MTYMYTQLALVYYKWSVMLFYRLNWYGKSSEVFNIFLFLFSKKMLVIRAGIHKMLVRIANREDPYQTAYQK